MVISAPAAAWTGTEQERTASPFTMTVQAPHCPSPQPNFGPFSARSSVSTYSSGVAGSTSTVRAWPLTRRLITLMEVPFDVSFLRMLPDATVRLQPDTTTPCVACGFRLR